MDNQHELIVGLVPETQSVDTPLQSSPPSAKEPLESALFLRGLGFNVLPVIGKDPSSFGKWTDLYSRPQTFPELESYNWNKATGIAMILGTSDIHSIDIDDVKDESILRDLLALLELPPDYEWVEKTGGGFQVFFLCHAEGGGSVDARKCVDGRADHFELRWKECISVVPPSAHYDKSKPTPKPDGKFYSWIHGLPIHKPIELTMPVVEMAYKALTKEKPVKPPKRPTGEYNASKPINQAVQRFNMREYLTAREIVWWELNDGEKQIRIEYLAGHSSLDWSDDFHSSRYWRDGTTFNLLDTIAFLEAHKTEKEPRGFDSLDKNGKKNITDLLAKYSGVSLESKLQLDLDPEVLIAEDERFLDEVVFTADSIGDDPDPVNWIVKDVMATEECFGLYGLPGEGKSYAALQLAISVASGNITEWLGFEIEKWGRVLYILNDGSMRSLKNRIRNISNYLHVPKPHDLMVLKKQGTFKTWKESVERIINIKNPILIVVDSLSMITNSKDENAVSEQVEFGGLLNEWCLNHKLNVLTIHHSNKGSVERPMGLVNWRGSSYWAGMLSSMMEFRKVGDSGHNKYKLVKSRDGEEGAMDTRECAYEKGKRRDGSYDFDASKPPSGYKYIGKAEELVPGGPPKAGRKKVFFPKLDEIFAPGETKPYKQAIEAIMIKYSCGKNIAIDTLKDWVASEDILRLKAKTGAVTYERKEAV